MPRKKKDHIDKLFDALEDKSLTRVELQLAERIINRRMKSRSYSLPEVEDAKEEKKTKHTQTATPVFDKEGHLLRLDYKNYVDGEFIKGHDTSRADLASEAIRDYEAAEKLRKEGEPKEKE